MACDAHPDLRRKRHSQAGHSTRKCRLGILVLAVLLCAPPAAAQERHFYRRTEYGSEAMFNPVALLLNGSLGILQYTNRPRQIFEIDYGAGFRNVTYNLSHPVQAIESYGWYDFVTNELIPGNISKKNAQYWPNYQNHLIGGGMDYIHVAEWYDDHQFASPRLWAFGTMVVYHVVNEVVENGAFVGENVDPIADLYVFDPLGIALFSFDAVPRFFSETLNMAAWPGQPAFAFNSRTIENQGENYSIKWRLPFSDRVSLFYYWGLTGLLGASYRTGDGRSFSLGAGLRAKELVPSGDQTNGRRLTAELTWNTGFFYDRDNSLMASVLFSGISDYTFHVNLYPGTIEILGFSGGLFFAVGVEGRFVAGLSLTRSPVGAALRF
jgi:hypothetical protein